MPESCQWNEKSVKAVYVQTVTNSIKKTIQALFEGDQSPKAPYMFSIH